MGLKGNLDIYLNEFEDYLKKATEAQPCNATGRSKPMFPKGSQQRVINDFAIRAMGNVWLHPWVCTSDCKAQQKSREDMLAWGFIKQAVSL